MIEDTPCGNKSKVHIHDITIRQDHKLSLVYGQANEYGAYPVSKIQPCMSACLGLSKLEIRLYDGQFTF